MNADTVSRSLEQTRRRLGELRFQANELPQAQSAAVERMCAELAQIADDLGSVERIAAHLIDVVNQMPAGVIVAEAPSGRVILINDQARRITGDPLASATLENKAATPFSLLHQDGSPYLPQEQPIARALRRGEVVVNEELEVLRGDGTRTMVAANAAPIRDDAGNVVLGVVTFHDVTERRRAGAAARLLAEAGATLAGSLDYQTTLSQLTRLLVPTLADFCIIDLLDETGRPQRVEVAFADPARASLAGDVGNMVEADWAAPHADAVRRGESILVPDYDDVVLHRFSVDDERRDVVRQSGVRSMIVVPLCVREQTIGAITLCAVHSARRYDEHDLALAQELARRAALAVDNARLYRDARVGLEARDAFLSIASHELKTPLTSLLGYAYVLENADPTAPDGAERLRRAIDVIKRQSRRLNELIENMLDLSRLQQGQFSIVRAPTDLALLLQRVMDELQLTAANHTLSLVGVDGPLPIEGDEVRLEQVFHNLVGNAVKYSPRGGPVSVVVSRDDRHVRIAVADRGIGVPQDALARLFTPFFRAANVGDGSSGFGIGLYIVKEIVERHDGAIAVSSTQGKGSTFEVTLPLAAML